MSDYHRGYEFQIGDCYTWIARNGIGRSIARVKQGCEEQAEPEKSTINKLWWFVRGGSRNAVENR